MGERRSSPRMNNVSGRGARREAASLRRDRRPAHVKKTQLGPEYVASALGEAARREAASLLSTADRRMSKLRPRCQRQPRRGHEEPVEATDALRPTGGGRSAESGSSQLPGGGSDPLRPPDQCPASEAINSSRQTGVQREKGLSLQSPDWTEDEGLSQLRRFGPRCLRRTNVNSASAAFPRGRPGESASSSGHARATGTTHPGFLWSETLEKA